MNKTSGRFEPIEFFENTISTDSSGFKSASGRVSYWATRAQVKPLSERRILEALKTDLRAGYEFTFRYRSDKTLNESMELDYNGKKLIIHSIVNVGEENKEIKVVGMVNDGS